MFPIKHLSDLPQGRKCELWMGTLHPGWHHPTNLDVLWQQGQDFGSHSCRHAGDLHAGMHVM
jgi:hypothetical protein